MFIVLCIDQTMSTTQGINTVFKSSSVLNSSLIYYRHMKFIMIPL